MQRLNGLTVLLTGGTGLLGRALLHRILCDHAQGQCGLSRVYVLLRRGRNGDDAAKRLENEVLQKDLLQHGKAEALLQSAQQLLLPVTGDITRERLGLPHEEYQALCRAVDVVVHKAGAVSLNAPLDEAVELNVAGAGAVASFAADADAALVHVSSAFVQTRENEWQKEKAVQLPLAPLAVLRAARRMNSAEVATARESGVLGELPNTWLFSKAVGERHVCEIAVSRRVPLVVLRPSILGAAWLSPAPGWTGGILTAAGAVYLAGGLGALRLIPGKGGNLCDVVPVDVAVRATLMAMCTVVDSLPASSVENVDIVHCTTTDLNPCSWRLARDAMRPFWRHFVPADFVTPADVAPFKGAARFGGTFKRRPRFAFIASPQLYQLRFFTQYSVPASLRNTVALVAARVLGEDGAASLTARARAFESLLMRVRVLTDEFRFFVERELRFDTTGLRQLERRLCRADAEDSLSAVALLQSVDWRVYNENAAFGLARHVLKLGPRVLTDSEEDPREQSVPITLARSATPAVQQQQELADDFVKTLLSRVSPSIKWSIGKKQLHPHAALPMSSPDKTVQSVLKSPRVVAAMQATMKQSGASASQVAAEADAICRRMFGMVNFDVLQSMGALLSNVFTRIYRAIVVNESALMRVKQQLETLNKEQRVALVLLPTHRSYVDFLVASFVTYAYGLPMPMIAAGEDFLGILGVRDVLRRGGAFFIRRSFSNDVLYRAIFDEYVAQLMAGFDESPFHACLEFFVEGTRSRSGKTLRPKRGLLTSVVSAALGASRRCDDAVLAPVAINYERTMEAHMYSKELLGEQKVRESLANLFAAARNVLSSDFGRISLNFCEPILLSQFAKQRGFEQLIVSDTTQSKRNAVERVVASAEELTLLTPLVKSLAAHLTHRLQQATEVMPTHVVATMALMYRDGGISRDVLVKRVHWVRDLLRQRGARCQFFQRRLRGAVVDNALRYLSSLLHTPRVGIVEPRLSGDGESKNALALAIYRNQLVSPFFLEACVAVSLYATSKSDAKCSTVNDVLQEAAFFFLLLRREFVYWHDGQDEDTPIDWQAVLRCMCEREVLTLSADGTEIHVARNEGGGVYSFLVQLMWPFVDSYYVAVLSLRSLLPKRVETVTELVQRAQWLATSLHRQQVLRHFEAASKDTLGCAFHVLRHSLQVLSPARTASGDKGVRLQAPFDSEANLRELLRHIARFRRRGRPQMTGDASTTIADVPILAAQL